MSKLTPDEQYLKQMSTPPDGFRERLLERASASINDLTPLGKLIFKALREGWKVVTLPDESLILVHRDEAAVTADTPYMRVPAEIMEWLDDEKLATYREDSKSYALRRSLED